MNAGRDVEALVAQWLAEEAEVRAPDRVLDSARRTIDRTMQRRWVAAWREPMTLTMTKVAALAAALVVALAGAAWIGRSTAPSLAGPAGGATSVPSAVASAPASAVTLETYTAARNEICVRYRPEINPLKIQMENMYDPVLPATDRADKVVALATTADRLEALANELRALGVPPELAAEHRADVANLDAIVVLIRAALDRLAKNDLTGAEADDRASDVFSARIRAFEARYNFLSCP